MEYTKKVKYQSNYWYNDGLKKASIRDMSGAITSLRRSLQYNQKNIDARNLLGLVYYGRGEVVEGLVEWIISKNFKSHENIASYYIRKIQATKSELEVINQSIKKYNQCLAYCEQGAEDLAIIQLKKVVSSHPTFVKGHQLLSLLYLKEEQYAKARQCLRKAHRLDTTNDITLRYMHELTQLRGKKVKEDQGKAVTYNVGNETIIQPVSSSLKDNATTITIVNIIIGILVGAFIVWFLIVPAVNETRASKANKEIKEYSNLIAMKNAELSAQKKELDEIRATSQESETAVENATTTAESYERLMTVSAHHKSSNYSNKTLSEELRAINRESLGNQGKEIFDGIAGEVYPSVCKKLYTTATESYGVDNFDGTIESLEQIMLMNEKYEDGEALLLLGDSYKKKGDKENAAIRYNRVIELFPSTEIAKRAEAGNTETDSE